jgi:CBS domain containing-hemolysin-like protein
MWGAALGFLVLRALLAAAESALYSTSDARVKELAAIYPRTARRVLHLHAEREATAAVLRTGMTLAGFIAAALVTLAPPIFDFAPGADPFWLSLVRVASSVLLLALIAALLDLTARAVATANPERWALRLSALVRPLLATLYPLLRFLVAILNVALRPLGGRVRFESPPPPLEELEKLLAAQAANRLIDKGAPQLIRSIFELSDKRSRDVMVPRTEVIALEITTPPEDILKILAEENHSRIPVYRDNIDHIVGVLHARDLIPLLQHPELIVLADTLRPAHFVPWVKPIGDLLREMQKKKIHMAMVVDEYGGFMGVVTLEDILREIVGDIGDEFEVEKKMIEKQPDGSFLVDASLDVAKFVKAFGFGLPEGEYDTLGGFLSSLAGSIPEVGDHFAFNGWQFIVHTKDGPRIERIRLVKPKGSTSTAREKELRPTG